MDDESFERYVWEKLNISLLDDPSMMLSTAHLYSKQKKSRCNLQSVDFAEEHKKPEMRAFMIWWLIEQARVGDFQS